jgi:adenylylsulfate kinase
MSRPKTGPGFAVWLIGLPSSGKSALARALSEKLEQLEIETQILDSDQLRHWLTPEPTYSQEERDWFYQAVVRIAELLAQNGVNVLIAATAPKQQHRLFARELIEHFVVVHLKCPLEICRQRDSKGLWEKASRGEITTLPGAGFPFEAPISPDVVVDTSELDPEQAAYFVYKKLVGLDFL